MTASCHRYRLGSELLPYQRRWVGDPARFKFGLIARQVGKDFSSAFEGICDCYAAELTGQKITWLIAAPSGIANRAHVLWQKKYHPVEQNSVGRDRVAKATSQLSVPVLVEPKSTQERGQEWGQSSEIGICD